MTFEVLYEQHFDFVWRSLRRLGLHPVDARDAAQEVFLVVLRRLSDFESRSKITTWLFSICFNVAGDRKRSAQRREIAAAEPAERWEMPDHDDPAALLERSEELALLDAILDELPGDQRIAFSLFELEDMSGAEIAQALGVSVATVHSRIRLARLAFREAVARFEARSKFRASQARRTGSSR